MSAKSSDAGFVVWDADMTTCGPVGLPTLVSWVKAGRVTAGTWVFVARDATWQRAADVLELQLFFQAHLRRLSAQADSPYSVHGIAPSALRHIKLLSCFTDEQLERFAEFVEVERMPQGAVVVRQGECGNAMYLIIEGALSVRMNVGRVETTLATLGIGEFFGDIALFDHGPRTADVVANTDCVLLKISVEAFELLSREAADLATPFLRAIGKTLTARIRAGNRHHGEAVKFSQALS
jgi:CRP/FNR family transcriptional regulator, cyclic AMP receptor protein